jgi:hypothetical protein
MSDRIERTRRTYDVAAGRLPGIPVHYWRRWPPEERLRETLQLHGEGNALFKAVIPHS